MNCYTAIISTLLVALVLPLSAATDFAAVQHILETRCVQCHGADKQKGELALHTAPNAAKGGESGEPAIVPGKPDASVLIQRVALEEDDDEIMPPKGDPLTASQQATLRSWIEEGAVWPEDVVLVERDSDAPMPEPDTKPIVKIQAFPPDVHLTTNRDFHRLVIMATYEDGTTKDVTSSVKADVADASLVSLKAAQLTPLSDGETTVAIDYRGKTCEVPVKIDAATTDRPVSFQLDVMPVFMSAGCNTGSCHGAARGKDGFMLSLFGYDPRGDYHRLTREFSGRRINLALPEESLLLEKVVEAVPHSGGKRFEVDSVPYNTLLRWLKADAPDDPKDVAQPLRMEIYPKQMVLEGEGATQQMTVRCFYSDGTNRDVTPLAVFGSNNAISSGVSPDGLVTANARGEAFIMARFATFTEGSQCIVIPKNLDYARPELTESNFIDSLVHEKLHKLRILPSEICSDDIFLRRAYLDIIGKVPEPETYHAFTADSDPKKREKLVDTLLERKEFTELWVMKFAELLQIRTQNNRGVSYKSTLLYFNWLQDRIANNVPFDKIVQELLGATGGTFGTPATNYYQIERDTLKLAENCAQVFMGMRLQCAQCHNHPFDRWTMNDYYGFASFFTQVGRKKAEDPRETIVFNSGGGETNHPVTKKPVPPKFLGGEQPETKGKDRRKVLAEWLASEDNPYFATNLSNLIWAHFFGMGIIDPVDDVRISNPASNPELLAELGKRFTSYNYDFKRLVRDIGTSQTYQRSTRANDSNADNDKNFARALIRRQRAEVLLDSISQVTVTKNKFRGLPQGARAVQIADGNVSTYFLKTFGRAERETVCSCEVRMDPNLGQALHLLNGDATGNRILSGGVIESQLKEGLEPAAIIEDLYIRCFSRKPSPEELKQVLGEVDAVEKKEKRAVLEDIFWALLNSKEFLFNH
jgi:mono/diheme cytochrome c family protein